MDKSNKVESPLFCNSRVKQSEKKDDLKER